MIDFSNFKVERVDTLEGVVSDSAILSPLNSFLKDNEEYGVTLTFPNSGVVEELQQAFRCSGVQPGSRQGQRPWLCDDGYSVRASSLLQPRATKKITDELTRGSVVRLRVRPEVVSLEEGVIERLILVAVDNTSYDPTDDEFEGGFDF